MADPTPAETPKKSYIILQRPSADQLQDEVNKHINAEEATKKYVPYGPMMIVDGVFYQVMTLASLYVYKISNYNSGSVEIKTGEGGSVAVSQAQSKAWKVTES